MSIFDQILTIDKTNNIGITGLTDGFFGIYLSQLLRQKKRSILVLTSTLFEANKIMNSTLNYTDRVLLFPMDDFLTSEAIAISPDLKVTRLETLNALENGQPMIVITNLMGYLRYLPTSNDYQKSILKLSVGDEIAPKELVFKLSSNGYERQTIVSKTGEVGVRGFVIDVFPIGENHPVRLEFFGDTIESIRYFDEEDQKSIQEIQTIEIKPYHELLVASSDTNRDFKHKEYRQLTNKIASILSYLKDPITIYKDYNQIKLAYRNLQEEILEYRTSKDVDFKGEYMFSLEEIQPKQEIYYLSLDNLVTGVKLDEIIHYDSKEIINFNENIDLIRKYLKENIDYGKTIIICLKEYQVKNFTKHLNMVYTLTDEEHIQNNKINIIVKDLNCGFGYRQYIVLTDKELFHTKETKKQYKTKFKYAAKIKDINKLNIGDYVVHNIHGIGIYNGIRTLTKGSIKKDYLEILYQGKDKLYIPVEKIDLISKFAGKEGAIPKVHKLGGTEWQKTKLRVKNKVKDIAEQLIRLYAERELRKGFMFQKDTPLQYQFEQDFPYQPTKDQLLAIEQIKQDMEASQPMDRLLCGDVGYGKTEVAFRTAFKAIMDSKQVLFLCPTTILSNQHYENAKERFKNFPVNIALLNRFTPSKEVKKILDDLKTGLVDMVIGTHRLLSKDVQPKDLGLLIIDEEQRFGVAHKERIKEYKTNVDVLTLTATPIPRTLQMSMVGIRSLSLIETPPVNRYPVQTYVVEENQQIIKDAIYKELSRNGQVFLLYNRVETIEQKVIQLQRLVPEARIIFAHGKMTKTELEDKMIQFIHHEYDVLVCTTIIETGIDIPNVNTLIILDADRFGLSQLYQIRGRVGRSNKIAYAYLMYQPAKVLTETAVKRLNVIKEFTELGSGFSIATRDLSIRGAGDILGSEQAGFIDTVGIDLYLKILNEEVQKLKGKVIEEEEEKDEKPLLDVETHIDDSYVDDTELKIEIHQKINQIDSYDKLLQIKQELEDRFGKIHENILIYMYEEWFEKLAKKLQIVKVQQTKNSIELLFSKEMTEKIDTEELFLQSYKISPMFRFQAKGDCLGIVLDTIKLTRHPIYYLIDLLEQITYK